MSNTNIDVYNCCNLDRLVIVSLQDAYFGGMLKLVLETESSYFEKSTTVGVGLQAEGVFGEIVKLKGGVGVSNTKVDGDFKKSSKESMRCRGGGCMVGGR